MRHFATAWNEKGLLQGRRNEPILPPSESYASKLKAALYGVISGTRLDVILTSQMIRTQQTAVLMGFPTFQIDPNLDELDFGAFEGANRDALQNEFGEAWINQPRDLILGESLVALEDRINCFLQAVHQHETVLCFGHGAWMRALYSITLHDGDINFMNTVAIPNASVLVVTMNNDTATEVKLQSLDIQKSSL